jgi:hypothetical protein
LIKSIPAPFIDSKTNMEVYMKSLVTLGEVSNRVDAMNKDCFDRLVDVHEISFLSHERMKIADDEHTLRPVAQKSIAWRLGIPFNYLAKCPQELQAEQMNHWIKHEKREQLFVRLDGEEVRAIFTPRYKPVDNFEVLARLDEMGYGPDTQVHCHLDAEFMLLSIPDGRHQFKINGDKMTPGISVSNSEVGLASLSVSTFILRLVCTNGMVAKTEISASYRHVSTKILTELPQVFKRVGDGLGKQKDRLKLSLESLVAYPLASIESFNRQFGLGEMEISAVEWAWPQEAGETMFAVVNTYTRAAAMEGLPAESSFRLQRVGGEVLGMLH